MSNLSEVAPELQKALAESEKSEATLEKARTSLAPLEEAVKEKQNAVAILMPQYEGLDIDARPTRSGRRGPRKTLATKTRSRLF